MIRKILAVVALSASLGATVFDYRLNYGSVTSDSDNVMSYTACVYNYFDDSDFALGVQGDITPLKIRSNTGYLTSFSLLAGYDLSRIFHTELNVGPSVMLSNSSYYAGIHAGAVLLVQTNLQTFVEALQFGLSASIDKFHDSLIEDQTQYKIFVGFGF